MLSALKKVVPIYIIICSAFQVLNAQNVQSYNIPVEVYGNQLGMPWVGGLDAPQFSEVDLNNDGIMDLFIFDRIGNTRIPLINEGTANASSYVYAPEYEVNFPTTLSHFVLIRDYNGDGIGDLFSYAATPGITGMSAYTGYYDSNNRIAFNLLHDVIYYPNLSNGLPVNLPVLNIDIPAVDDLDCDGDLDILSFEISGGNIIWYKNMSVEMGYGLDSLRFRLEENCYGGVYESGFAVEIDLPHSEGQCADGFHSEGPAIRHAGSTILTLDTNNDDSKEVFLGDISFSNITMLENAPNCGRSFIIDQDNNFPSYDSPVAIDIFPGSFHLDLNNDGLKDFIASPNNINSSFNINNVWYYKNTNTNEFPVFQLQQKNLFTEEMIDLGTQTVPTFADVNQDGLLDLVVGTSGQYKPFGERDPRLYLFLNVGTATAPAFELTDDNWLDFNVYGADTQNFGPSFGDLDGDGDLDLLVGEQWGSLFFVENTAGAGNPMVFGAVIPEYFELDVGLISRPIIFDLNEDGLNDIIAGERNGILNYFQNYGTSTAPLFYATSDTLQNNSMLGGVDTRSPGFSTGQCSPFIYNDGLKSYLLSGSEKGGIFLYENVTSNTSNTYLESTTEYGSIQDGQNTSVALADLDGDNQLELVVGNQRGGLNLYKTNLLADATVGLPPIIVDYSPIDFIVAPNPAQNQIFIQFHSKIPETYQIHIFQIDGKLVHTTSTNTFHTSISTKHLSSGIYYLNVQSSTISETQKLIIE